MSTSLRTAVGDARASTIPRASARPSAASVWALGRIEAKRMLLHPSFPIATAFGLLLLRGAIGSGGGGMTLSEKLAWAVGGLMVGVLFGTVLSANVAALRPRRDRTRELFGATPASPETRTAGVFTGLLLGPVAVSVVLTALAWWAFQTDEDVAPDLDLFLAVQIPLAAAALGAVAIAVGRWVPSLLGGPLVLAAHIFTPILWLVPWVLPSSDVERPWHILYIVAAITTWVALALARDRRTVPRFAVAAGAFAIGIVAAVQQVPPGGW
jgi:hypothetical protein